MVKVYITDPAAARVLVDNLQVKPEANIQEWSMQNTPHYHI